jgi:hypothetical protein
MRRELVALIVLAACRAEEPPAAMKTTREHAAIGGAAAPLAEKPFFRIDATPQPPCTAGASCEARLVLTALGDYHVNERYPMKFIGDAAPGIELLGEGTFALDNAKTGTLTLRFRAVNSGTTRVTGTFKLSVCTDENCEIEAPKLAFDITAS